MLDLAWGANNLFLCEDLHFACYQLLHMGTLPCFGSLIWHVMLPTQFSVYIKGAERVSNAEIYQRTETKLPIKQVRLRQVEVLPSNAYRGPCNKTTTLYINSYGKR